MHGWVEGVRFMVLKKRRKKPGVETIRVFEIFQE